MTDGMAEDEPNSVAGPGQIAWQMTRRRVLGKLPDDREGSEAAQSTAELNPTGAEHGVARVQPMSQIGVDAAIHRGPRSVNESLGLTYRRAVSSSAREHAVSRVVD